MRLLCCIALSLALTGTAIAQEGAQEGWTSYHNTRFGTTADVPKGWTMGAEPENNDGRVFTSPDNAATLSIYGGLNIEDSLDAAFKFYETASEGETITYKRRIGPAIFVSGTKDAMNASGAKVQKIYYAKHLLSCGNQIWNSAYFEYAPDQKAALDPIIAHVIKSLKPGAGYQIEKCAK